MNNPDMPGSATPDALDRLRAEFPAWKFEEHWTSAGSGPDRCLLIARLGALMVSAWDAAALAAAIRAHESGQR